MSPEGNANSTVVSDDEEEDAGVLVTAKVHGGRHHPQQTSQGQDLRNQTRQRQPHSSNEISAYARFSPYHSSRSKLTFGF